MISFHREGDQPVKTAVQYYWALRTLAYAWAFSLETSWFATLTAPIAA